MLLREEGKTADSRPIHITAVRISRITEAPAPFHSLRNEFPQSIVLFGLNRVLLSYPGRPGCDQLLMLELEVCATKVGSVSLLLPLCVRDRTQSLIHARHLSALLAEPNPQPGSSQRRSVLCS